MGIQQSDYDCMSDDDTVELFKSNHEATILLLVILIVLNE